MEAKLTRCIKSEILQRDMELPIEVFFLAGKESYIWGNALVLQKKKKKKG